MFGADSKRMDSIWSENDMQEFIQLAQCPPFSLALLDFAQTIDNVLPSILSDRMKQIVAIIEQVFGVRIEPHRMFDKLAMMKKKTTGGNFVLKHNKNINDELLRYSSNASNICQYPKSAPFCLPISLESPLESCPQ